MKIEINDIKWIGKEIVVWVDGNGRLSRVQTNMKIGPLTIIGVSKQGMHPYIFLGAKTPGAPLSTRLAPSKNNLYVNNQSEFGYGLSVALPFEFDSIVGEPGVPITSCRKCGYENYSGAANQKDGTYLCKQCDIFSHIFGS